MSTLISWSSPVELEAAQKRRAELEIERLTAQIIARWEAESGAFGLMDGKVGLGFSMYELAASGVPDADEHAERALVGAVDQFNTGGANPGLHSGIAGLGWLVDAWLGEEDLCGPIDDSLREKVEGMTAPEPVISLRAGLIGIGLYAARRASRVSSARALLEAVAATLARASHQTREGLTWNTPGSYWEGRGGSSDLFKFENKVIREYGVAHGVAPLALLLSQMEQLGLSGVSSTSETLRWMWSTTQAEPNRFAWACSDSERTELNVATWCTGDPGVAFVSWLAARSSGLNEEAEKWASFGRELAQRFLGGERPARPERIDLCCGLAGVLQIFSSWAAMSGEPAFADVTRALLTRLLNELDTGGLDKLPIGLQFGLAGLAATLTAQTSGRPPAWAGPLAIALPHIKASPLASP